MWGAIVPILEAARVFIEIAFQGGLIGLLLPSWQLFRSPLTQPRFEDLRSLVSAGQPRYEAL
jgi:hypothetical protein